MSALFRGMARRDVPTVRRRQLVSAFHQGWFAPCRDSKHLLKFETSLLFLAIQQKTVNAVAGVDITTEDVFASVDPQGKSLNSPGQVAYFPAIAESLCF